MKKVILLNGFAGVGKTTISKMYINENPLSISIEGDQIIGMMGQWRKYEPEARELVFEHTKAMLKTHLKSNNDVILPYLLTDARHAVVFEQISKDNNAEFFEIILHSDKEEAVARLLERGFWGEEGSERLSARHQTKIESLFDLMMDQLAKRTKTIKIEVIKGDINDTYSNFLRAIDTK